jgi:SM-20-related protein
MTLRLNPDLDAAALAQQFSRSKRLQIDTFLEPDDARKLAESLASLDWSLALNSKARHVDLPPALIAQMGEARMSAILTEVRKNAARGFQYLYENYPVSDLQEAGRLDHPLLIAVHDLMNSPAVRSFLAAVTGMATDFCDMQATRYSAGHFLTVHDDNAGSAKNRKLAYVLGLTKSWSPTWGGQLQFLDGNRVLESFAPQFNALSVFAVPFPHHVSQVASFAPIGRVSLTGWFRKR